MLALSTPYGGCFESFLSGRKRMAIELTPSFRYSHELVVNFSSVILTSELSEFACALPKTKQTLRIHCIVFIFTCSFHKYI